MIGTKGTTTIAILLGIIASQIAAAGADPVNVTGSITISPSSPSKTWPAPDKADDAILSPNYSASLTITVDTVGTANGVEYVIDGKPTFTTNLSDQNIVWSTSGDDYSKTLTLTNTAGDAATASISVSCKWKPKNGSGKGTGKAPAPIPGSGTVTSSLIDSAVSWDFDRTLQLADGTRVINWTATFKDTKGRPLGNVSNVVISAVGLDPASAAWTITPDASNPQTPGNVRKGTVKSSDGATGKLKVDYSDGSAETNTADTVLTFAKAVFHSMAVRQHNPFSFYPNRPPGYYQLGGSTVHEGKVQIIPKSARDKFKIRFFQTLNSLVKVPGTSMANVPSAGIDVKYNGYSAAFTTEGDDFLKIASSDFPGPALTQSQCLSMGVGPIASMDMNFNLYLQYLFDTDTGWHTSGKATWGVHGTLKFELNQNGNTYAVPNGSVTPGTGAASTETPVNPASSNP